MKKVGILESRFDRDKDVSIASIFQFMDSIPGVDGKSYVLERFSGKKSFDEAINYFIKERSDVVTLYISSHGEECGRFFGHGIPNGEGVSFTELKNDLKRADGKIKGLYLGSCFFGMPTNQLRMLEEVEGLDWIAGYSEEVDWIESSALDMLFFKTFLSLGPSSFKSRARKSAEFVFENCSALAGKLGFSLSWRDRSGSICTLPSMT